MKRAVLLVPIVATLLMVSIVVAQSGDGYDLTWSTIDGGGSVSNGAGYSLASTIGRPAAGTLSGGTYTLSSGFLTSVLTLPFKIYLPLIVR